MSNDTMPCGCEGHADNEGLCNFPKLEAEFQKRTKELEYEASVRNAIADGGIRQAGEAGACVGSAKGVLGDFTRLFGPDTPFAQDLRLYLKYLNGIERRLDQIEKSFFAIRNNTHL